MKDMDFETQTAIDRHRDGISAHTGYCRVRGCAYSCSSPQAHEPDPGAVAGPWTGPARQPAVHPACTCCRARFHPGRHCADLSCRANACTSGNSVHGAACHCNTCAKPASLIPLLEQMAGETTLKDAQQTAEYPILLPTYPTGLGKPDRVFVQDADGPMTILVWIDHQHPDRVKMSLHFIPEGSWAVDKFSPHAVEETSVNGNHAVWAVGPYPILLKNGDMKISRMVTGHVLIWEEGGVTYRLETDSSMEEAVRIAELLEPVP